MTALIPYMAETQPSLYDCIIDPANLLKGWQRVRRNKGAQGGDGVTWQRFETQLESELDRLHGELNSGRYRPGRLRRVPIPKPSGGQRILTIPPIRDRVIQTAAVLALTPLLDRLMSDNSFAYRPGRSTEMALHQVRDAMAHGRHWVVDIDIERFFDTIPHQRLVMELAIWVNDERFLALTGQWLRSFSFWRWRWALHKGRGIAQGAPISPLLANLYLHPVDRILAAANITAVRYADDFVLLCASQRDGDKALGFMQSLMDGRGLSINRRKTGIIHASQGLVFLGQTLGGPDFALKPILDCSTSLERPADDPPHDLRTLKQGGGQQAEQARQPAAADAQDCQGSAPGPRLALEDRRGPPSAV